MFRRHHKALCDWKSALLLFAFALLQSLTFLRAQSVMVNVTPVQPILPPQVLLYVSDPGKFFNIQLSNNSGTAVPVHLQMEIEHVNPSLGLRVITPTNVQPPKPFIVPANGTYQLNQIEMNALFDHIPSDMIQAPQGLFDDVTGGSFGLLPEGQYRARVVAYKWADPQYEVPVVASNPASGTCLFTVCYKAQAPEFLPNEPVLNSMGNREFHIGEIVQFNWTIPTINCGASATYNYDFRVVEVLPGQQPDDAILRNPIVYQVKQLVAPTCIIPTDVVNRLFRPDKDYICQVTANPNTTSALNYVMINNGGESDYRMFHIAAAPGVDTVDETAGAVEEVDPVDLDIDTTAPVIEVEVPDDDEEDWDSDFLWLGSEVTDSISTDALYTFRNPTITLPTFDEFGARRKYIGDDINVAWNSVFFLGGEGEHPEALKFTYEVKLFKGDERADKDSTLLTTPIFTKTVINEEDLSTVITWAELEPLVKKNDYLVLQIVPTCTNEESIAYYDNEANVVDFAIVEHLYKTYFECSNQLIIENTTPTTKSADDLKGKTITIGEYKLTLDSKNLKKNSNGSFEGRGKVEWNPMNTTVMVCVKFDSIRINTDDMVYSGDCRTYAQDNQLSDAEVVEKLFTDWGIDEYIGDSGLPYASAISDKAKSGAKDLAKKIDLSKYYGYVTKGQAIWNALGTGNIDELYLPVELPEAVNKSPIKIQISTMKFAPTHATMDLIGEFTLPNSNYLKNDILVFGAPRLCISPESIVPESGTIALLSDFAIKDPKSSYEMTFKCPQDLLKPYDGCYISWHDYSFEMLGVDIDMKIPGLVKDSKGEVAKDAKGNPERPVLNIRASFSDWDDMLVDHIGIDDFQAEDLPGWTFTASDIVYDHSLFRNSDAMGAFPSKYDKKKAGITGLVQKDGKEITVTNDNDWTGLFIKTVGIKFPKSFEFGTSSDKRLSIEATDMFFDKSGATLGVGVNHVFEAQTGKLGGWAFSLEEVRLNFLQNNFDNCKISGEIGVPLIKTEDNNPARLAYDCQIRKAIHEGKETDNTAYIFTIQQMEENMNLDFILAKAKFAKSLTYFAVEAESSEAETTTRVELLMGGNLRIAGSDWAESFVKGKLNIDVSIPDIHFSGLRIANCEPWTSEYASIKGMQSTAFNDATKTKMSLYEGTTFSNDEETFFFSTGAWSLASMSKKLGPFEFSLEGIAFEDDKEELPEGSKAGGMNKRLTFTGKVKVIEDIDISAAARMSLRFSIYNLSSITNVSAAFNGCKVDSIGLHTSFCGVTLNGSLLREDTKARKGFEGKIKVVLPGDIFALDMKGGYYDETPAGEAEQYTWGYFVVAMSGEAGIPIPPVQISGLTGGFYFNCSSSAQNPEKVTPKKGKIGIILGMKLSTVGSDDILSGDFSMTVVYDKDRDGKGKGGLSQFLFVGSVEAVGGLVNSKMTLLYENTEKDEYFQLTITTDSKLDNVKALTELNEAFEKFEESHADLKNLENAEKESNKDHKASGEVKTANDEQTKTASLGSVSVTLDVKITNKANGKKLDKVKWHVYLGEPSEDKRCKLVLIDFKSKVVTVTIGANAYVCAGNELPNDGQLPPIPDKIAKFLDGSENGTTVSDGIETANAARAQATANFGGSVTGGVMFGAQVYGYIDVNLGIINAGLDALAGFDVSLRKLHGAVCTNTNGHPGWNEWYGQGQLYAYFAAWLNLHINLGFYKKDLEIANAALGGVLNMGGPNPTYFDGKIRAKVSALGGLVKINKKFTFACGNKCDLFYGNPLDNFILWDYCSLGDTIQNAGWNEENALDPYLTAAPYVNTSAPLEQHFRVLDENEFQKIAENYNGNIDDLKIEAERTFVFRAKQQAYLYTYDNPEDYGVTKTQKGFFNFSIPVDRYTSKELIEWTGGNPTHHILDLAALRKFMKPNKYYRLELNGSAFELQRGKEVDPVHFDTITSKYSNKPWRQTKNFFFCTGKDRAFADTCSLEKFIAVAYPSNYNTLHDDIKDADTDSYFDVYASDAQRPTIALTKDISTTAYRKGKLYWRVLNTRGQELQRVENAWVRGEGYCNMEPRYALSQMKADGRYILSLDYATFSSDTEKGTITSDTLNIGRLHVHLVNGDWQKGYKNKNLPYEEPFKASQLVSYSYPTFTLSKSRDIDLALDQVKIGGKLARHYDPFFYIGYLSNFAFIGGWETDNNRFKLDITTTQSAVLRVPGAGNYEGAFGSRNAAGRPADDNLASRILEDLGTLRSMFFYDATQYSGGYGRYPLPTPVSGTYDYILNIDARAARFTPASTPLGNVQDVLSGIKEKYNKTQLFAELIREACLDYTTYGNENLPKKFTEDDMVKQANAWLQLHRGTYLTTYETKKKETASGYKNYVKSDGADDQFLTLPYYQIGFTGGIASLVAKLHKIYPKIMRKEHYRACEDVAIYTLYCLNGREGMPCTFTDDRLYDDGTKLYYQDYLKIPEYTLRSTSETFVAEDAMKLVADAKISVYRVNGYNFETGNYQVVPNLLNGCGYYEYKVNNPLTESAAIDKSYGSTIPGNSGSSSTGVTTGSNFADGMSLNSNDEADFRPYADRIVGYRNQIQELLNSVDKAHDQAATCVDKKNSENAQSLNTRIQGCLKNAYNGNLSQLGSAKDYFSKLYNYTVYENNRANLSNTKLSEAQAYLDEAEKDFAKVHAGARAKSMVYIEAEKDITTCRKMLSDIVWDRNDIADMKSNVDSLYADADRFIQKIDVIQDPNYKTRVTNLINRLQQALNVAIENKNKVLRLTADGAQAGSDADMTYITDQQTKYIKYFTTYETATDRGAHFSDYNNGKTCTFNVEKRYNQVLEGAGYQDVKLYYSLVPYNQKLAHTAFDSLMELIIPNIPAYDKAIEVIGLIDGVRDEADAAFASYRTRIDDMEVVVNDAAEWRSRMATIYSPYENLSFHQRQLSLMQEEYDRYESTTHANFLKSYEEYGSTLQMYANNLKTWYRNAIDVDTRSVAMRTKSLEERDKILHNITNTLANRNAYISSTIGDPMKKLDDLHAELEERARLLMLYASETDDAAQMRSLTFKEKVVDACQVREDSLRAAVALKIANSNRVVDDARLYVKAEEDWNALGIFALKRQIADFTDEIKSYRVSRLYDTDEGLDILEWTTRWHDDIMGSRSEDGRYTRHPVPVSYVVNQIDDLKNTYQVTASIDLERMEQQLEARHQDILGIYQTMFDVLLPGTQTYESIRTALAESELVPNTLAPIRVVKGHQDEIYRMWQEAEGLRSWAEGLCDPDVLKWKEEVETLDFIVNDYATTVGAAHDAWQPYVDAADALTACVTAHRRAEVVADDLRQARNLCDEMLAQYSSAYYSFTSRGMKEPVVDIEAMKALRSKVKPDADPTLLGTLDKVYAHSLELRDKAIAQAKELQTPEFASFLSSDGYRYCSNVLDSPNEVIKTLYETVDLYTRRQKSITDDVAALTDLSPKVYSDFQTVEQAFADFRAMKATQEQLDAAIAAYTASASAYRKRAMNLEDFRDRMADIKSDYERCKLEANAEGFSSWDYESADYILHNADTALEEAQTKYDAVISTLSLTTLNSMDKIVNSRR